jgi:hypothetical protein
MMNVPEDEETKAAAASTSLASASSSSSHATMTQALASDPQSLHPLDMPPLQRLIVSMLDAQRGFLDFMFLNLNVEMDHLDVFQNSVAIASSADAIAYCEQVRNICQEKMDAVAVFMEKIVEAQEKAMAT